MAVLVMVAAGVLPLCACTAQACCSPASDAPLVAAVPCCAAPSFSPGEENPSSHRSASGVASPHVATPAVIPAQPNSSLDPPRVSSGPMADSTATRESSPPLFLLNEQFLI